MARAYETNREASDCAARRDGIRAWQEHTSIKRSRITFCDSFWLGRLAAGVSSDSAGAARTPLRNKRSSCDQSGEVAPQSLRAWFKGPLGFRETHARLGE